jgi:formamidopyrimidine-DNA glycosylase
MPEYPDICLYVERIKEPIVGKELQSFRVGTPFVVRTVNPPATAFVGKSVQSVERLGKRLVFHFQDELFALIHLMVAGRFDWQEPPIANVRSYKSAHNATFFFAHGSLSLVEYSKKKRASISFYQGLDLIDKLDRGGLDVFDADLGEFHLRLISQNRILKRALTDPEMFDGIGNAYSDEILHKARLSPIRLTKSLSEQEIEALYKAARSTLEFWRDKLLADIPGFPTGMEVTSHRDEFAVHRRFGLPCPVCQHKIQRIDFQDKETNYCAFCQTNGKLLADRSLSRLLKNDWPQTIEEWEERCL